MANFTPQEIEEILQAFFDVTGKRQYVGARYVPIFGRKNEDSIEWDNHAAYEPLTIVIHNGDSFTSKRYVPAGVDIYDSGYWARTGTYNAQVEQYRQEVLTFDNRITQLDSSVDTRITQLDESVDERVNELSETYDARITQLGDDCVPFPVEPNSKYGNPGQTLYSDGNGNTIWNNPVIVTSEVAAPLIEDWLDEHPEATTSVLDNSLTDAKLVSSGGVLESLGNSVESYNAILRELGFFQGASIGTPAIVRYLTNGATSSDNTLTLNSGYNNDNSWIGYAISGSSAVSGLSDKLVLISFDISIDGLYRGILEPYVYTDVSVSKYTVLESFIANSKAFFLIKFGSSVSGLNFRCLIKKKQTGVSLSENVSITVSNGTAINVTSNTLASVYTYVDSIASSFNASISDVYDSMDSIANTIDSYDFFSNGISISGASIQTYLANGAVNDNDTLRIPSGSLGTTSYIAYRLSGSSKIASLANMFLDVRFSYTNESSIQLTPIVSTDIDSSKYTIISKSAENGSARFLMLMGSSVSGLNLRFALQVNNSTALPSDAIIAISGIEIKDVRFSPFDANIRTLKIGMFGDSITWGSIGNAIQTDKGLPYWVSQMLGCTTVNYGVGSQGWIAEVNGNNGLDRIKAMQNDFASLDVVTLQYGVNDGNATLGTYLDTAEDTTIMGQIYNAYQFIKSKNPLCRVILVAPTNTCASSFDVFPKYWLGRTLGGGHTGQELVDEYKKFADYYNVPFITYLNSPMTAFNIEECLADGVHPNVNGYKILGQYLAGQIGKFI